jgi:hypothetical protein
MSNPTTPFSWQMPTATDLVTDLPADFEVFGQAVATSMGDLLGGTTGQVLSKTSATDMAFTWVDTDDTNAIQNAIVTAKGDLIGASASATPLVIAVGTDGQTLVADSAEATGLKWATAASGSTFVGAVVYNSTDLTITNNTFTTATFNSQRVDTNTFHDTSTNTSRITIPAGYAGQYLIWCDLEWAGSATGVRTVRLLLNAAYPGSTSATQIQNATTAGETQNNLFFYRSLSVGDYLELSVKQTSGGSLALGGSTSGYMNQFGVQYLGA